MKNLYLLFITGLLLAVHTSMAQSTPYLVKDINPNFQQRGLFAEDYTILNGEVYFRGSDGDRAGTELWKSDGTDSGTVMVEDFLPGNYGIHPRELETINNQIIFSGHHPIYGVELFITDGTPGNMRLLKDINPGLSSQFPSSLTAFNNKVIFTVTTPSLGREPWVTDGTTAGTMILKDIDPGNGYSNPERFTVVGNQLFFRARSPSAETELWVTDGTPAGTQMVKDINPSGSSYPSIWTDYKGLLYFSANDGVNGSELWVSDGTAAGTQMILQLKHGSGSSMMGFAGIMNGLLTFAAHSDQSNSSSPQELWTYDGTTFNTIVDFGMLPGSPGSIGQTTSIGNKMIFRARTSNYGSELYVTDGTQSGTFLLKDINPGPASSVPANLTRVGNEVFFSVGNGTEQLWKTDGTVAGTVMLLDLGAGGKFSSGIFFDFNGKLLFDAELPTTGREIWISDGTTAGTKILKNFTPDSASSNILHMTDVDGTLFFHAQEGPGKYGLWKSNGTAASTQKVTDMMPVFRPEDTIKITSMNGQAYVSGLFNPGGTRELRKSDGTAAGTIALTDGIVDELTPYNGELFFRKNKQLWKTDGTPSGTKAVDSSFTSLHSLTPALGNLYYVASDPANTREQLWRSTPTSLTGSMVHLINASRSAKVSSITEFQGEIYFAATGNGRDDVELWKSDGVSSAQLVSDIYTGTNGSFPDKLSALGNSLFFSAQEFMSGRELWKTDGTQAGTMLVKDIYPGLIGSDIQNIQGHYENVLFFARTPTEGLELWTTDGTEAGTKLVKDIYPGKMSGIHSIENQLVRVGHYFLFSARDDQHGMELWQTDGTPAGTKMVYDIEPGYLGSHPSSLTLSGETLYFTAASEKGRELWALDVSWAGIGLEEELAPKLSKVEMFPNPTSGDFQMSFNVEETTRVKVVLTDLTGKNLGILLEDVFLAGSSISNISLPRGLTPGIYLLQVHIGSTSRSHKLIFKP